jgi:hypothetical protein
MASVKAQCSARNILSAPGVRRTLGLTGALVATAVVAPPAANAGTYHLYSCRTPAGQPAPLDGWSQIQPGFGGVTSSCVTGGFYGVTLNEQTSVGNPRAQLQFIPGDAALQVSAVRLFRSWSVQVGGAGGAIGGSATAPAGVPQLYGPFDFASATGSRGSSNAFDPNNRVEVVGMGPVSPGSYAVEIGAACTIPEGWAGCGGTYSYQLYSADLTLADSASPTVAVSGGDVFNDGKLAGTISGTRSAIVLGSDAGSGVYQAVVEVDGKDAATGSVADPSFRCVAQPSADGGRGFLYRQPCPANGSATVRWDTTKTPDGPHKVRLLLEDASGNRTVAAQGDLLVKNAAQTGPGSPIEFRGESNGIVGGDPGAAAPDNAQILMAIEVGAPRKCKGKRYARKHPVACSGRRPAVTRAYSSKVADKVSGRLQTPEGVGIANATLTVSGVPHGGTPGGFVMGNVTTDANGYFTASVIRNLSMDVVVSWNARTGDTMPAASQLVALMVKSATTLHAPKRSRSGKRAVFTGRLVSVGAGGIGIPARIPIQVQVQYRGRWTNIGDAALTDARGHWKLRYRWPKSLRGTGRVRAQVLPAPGFPYEASKSRTRVIRITH